MAEAGLHVSYSGVSELRMHTTAQGVVRPLILELHFDDLNLSMEAALDTGSAYCIMGADVARDLGIKPEDGIPGTVGAPRRIKGWIHSNVLTVSVPALKGEDLWAAPVWFISEEWDGQPLLLGWLGFLQTVRAFGCILGSEPNERDFFCFLSADAGLG